MGRHPIKLDWAKVAEIRALCAAGAKQTAVARQYGVSQHTISMIVNGLLWKQQNPVIEEAEHRLLDRLYDLLRV